MFLPGIIPAVKSPEHSAVPKVWPYDNGEIILQDTSASNEIGQEGRSLVFSGFIKTDLFYDTRQTVNAREALVTLYPQNVQWDTEHHDINARPGFNMLNIHSRLRCEITGPSIWGAKTAALAEADFYGNENKNFSDLNGLRLFNAYVRFCWKTTELLIGQDWHPMSIQGFFPGAVSFSAGAPFHPMSRNPQIRISQRVGQLKISGSLLTQRDFTGTGPEGPGSQYLRNSGIPNLYLETVFGGDSTIISGGVGVDYKKIVPELFSTNANGEVYKAKSALSGVSATCYMALKMNLATIKMQGVYAQNGYDQLMLGGYGVSSKVAQTGRKTYTNLNTLSAWADIQTRFKYFILGVFSGYTCNLGANERVKGDIYARGADISGVFRVAPRVVYTVSNVGVSLEGENTTAWYGTRNGDGRGRVTHAEPVTNFRALLSVRYSF